MRQVLRWLNLKIYELYSLYLYRSPLNITDYKDEQNRNILFCTWENRSIDYCRKSSYLNQLYCRKHAYTFCFSKEGYTNLPPYWVKVRFVLDKMIAHPEFEFIVWLDSDAVVANYTSRLGQIINLNSETVFWISFDPSITYHRLFYLRKIVNTGVFVVRNNRLGRRLMESWLTMYNPLHWKQHSEKWVNSGIYAGRSYEQGALNTLLLKQRKWLRFIELLPTPFFADDRSGANYLYTCHFMSMSDEKISTEFDTILKQWENSSFL